MRANTLFTSASHSGLKPDTPSLEISALKGGVKKEPSSHSCHPRLLHVWSQKTIPKLTPLHPQNSHTRTLRPARRVQGLQVLQTIYFRFSVQVWYRVWPPCHRLQVQMPSFHRYLMELPTGNNNSSEDWPNKIGNRTSWEQKNGSKMVCKLRGVKKNS